MLPLPRDHFGAVLAADVIEHVRDPEGWLLRILELLIPGGIVLLITPSLDSWISWTRRLLRSRWMEYKVEHLYYFSAVSIRLLLERCGFDEIRVSPSRKVLTIDYLSRHFDRFRVPILSPLIGLLRRAVPSRIVHRHLLVSASGLMAIRPEGGCASTQMNCPVCDESSFARLLVARGRAVIRCQGCGCVALDALPAQTDCATTEKLGGLRNGARCGLALRLALYGYAQAPRLSRRLAAGRRRRRSAGRYRGLSRPGQGGRLPG